MNNDHNHGPSAVGSVVLNLGGDIGALIIQARADLLGAEIEISPVDATGEARRTHSMVRERQTVPEPRYDAVYPDLPAGRYTIWRDAHTAAGDVTITGGRITTFELTAGHSAQDHDHSHDHDPSHSHAHAH